MELLEWKSKKRAQLRQLGPMDVRNVTPSIRDFAHAVTTQKTALAVIVELSRATPEEGPLREHLEIERLCAAADGASVSALAVGWDAEAFRGSDQDLAEIAHCSAMPVLARDLIVAPEQIYRARILGADAVLLHAGALDAPITKMLIEVASSTHMVAPVEVSTTAELQRALAAGARMVVLPAFSGAALSLEVPDALLTSVPRSVAVIVRGPFKTEADWAKLRGAADAIWICGPAMRATDVETFLRPLVEAAENG